MPVVTVLNDRRKRPYFGQQQTIFASSSGSLRDPENFDTAWRAVRDQIGMPEVTSHSFRKTVATRRIARDYPDIHQRMKNGEYPSVRAAARDAGIVRPTRTASPTLDDMAFRVRFTENQDKPNDYETTDIYNFENGVLAIQYGSSEKWTEYYAPGHWVQVIAEKDHLPGLAGANTPRRPL